MKKILTLAVAMATAAISMAQTPEEGTVTVRPEVGMTISTLSGDYCPDDYDIQPRISTTIGAEVDYQVNSWFGISGGITVSQLGAKLKNCTGCENGKSGHQYHSDFPRNIKFDYLNVPLLANFYVANGLALKIGIQPAFVINAKWAGLNIKDYVDNFDIHVPFGISYEYSNFILDARLSYDLTKVWKKGYERSYFSCTEEKEVNDYNSWFSITIGYKIPID